MDIGLVGTGPMGLGIGKSLLRELAPQGHSITVYNRTPDKAAPLVEAGARLAKTPAEAAGGDVVLSIVADDAAVAALTLSDNGILAGLKEGAVHAGMSTVTVDLADRLVAAHEAAGKHYVSAPVMGRPQAAAAGEIFIAAAGRPGDIAHVKPVFDAIAKGAFVIGEHPVQANLIKLGINYLVHSVVEGLAEFFALMEKGKVSPEIARDFLIGTSFNAPIYQRVSTLLLEKKFPPGSASARLALKDNRAIMAAGEKFGAPLPFASIVHDRLVALIAQGDGQIDYAAISLLVRRDAGLND
ncbi:MAG: NAD(P)-dependent oxidoreductase [Xanthobacteraceae bacterium]|jgi:3-hydroxyisobutyrate dehydrogenase-like beta-hydroxyacid dehydrogenase